MNQNDIVLKHLLSGRSLTQLEAIGVYRIYRLAGRIFDLRSRGHNIICNNKVDPTGKTYGEYRLVLRGRNGDRRAA